MSAKVRSLVLRVLPELPEASHGERFLRHANNKITLEVYTHAVTSHKRTALSKVVRMMVPNLGEMEVKGYPQNAG